MPRRAIGPVEAAVRKLVRDLGSLPPRTMVQVEQAYALARRLDDEPDGAKAATLSRELRLVTRDLAPAAVAGPAPRRELGETGSDPVAAIQDQLAKRRRDRAAGA